MDKQATIGGGIIGTFGVLEINKRKGMAKIGYGIHPKFSGKGYCREKLELVISHLINEMEIHQLWAKTQFDNHSSIRALEPYGFRREGVLRDFYLSSIDGKRSAAVILAIIAGHGLIIKCTIWSLSCSHPCGWCRKYVPHSPIALARGEDEDSVAQLEIVPHKNNLTSRMPRKTEQMFGFTAGHIFGLSALLTLPIAFFAPKGLAVLFGLTVLPFILAGLTGKRINGFWAGSSLRLAAVFVILAVASSLWSITPEVSMKKAFIIAFFLFGGVILTLVACRLDDAAKRTFDIGLIVGGGLGFVLIGIEAAFDSPLYRILAWVKGHIPQEYNYQKLVVEEGNTVIEAKIITYKGYIRTLLGQLNQGASVGAIFLLLWTMAVKRQKGPLWAAASFAIGITVLAYCIADSHKVALAIGLLAALTVFIGDRAVLKGFSFLIIFGVLAAPWTVSFLPDPLQPNNTVAQLPNSSQHRLVIWQTTAAHIFKRPVFGSGFDTARAFYGEDQRVVNYYGGKKSHGPNLIPSNWASYFEPIPLHPHNGVLQVWLELGAAGALLLAAGLFLIVRRLGGVENRFERAMVFGSFITGLVVFCVSYGAWQSWWIGTIWLMMVYGAAFCQDKSQ